MIYDELIDKLESIDVYQTFPLYVPSVLRPAHFLYRNIISFLPRWYKKERIVYLTRKEWYQRYRQVQNVRIETVPEHYEYPGYGTDTTRRALFDLARSEKHDYIFDWDDDIDSITMAYSAGANTRRLRKEDREKYAINILALASQISREAFEQYDDLCLGRLNRVTPSTCGRDFHKDKLWINHGGIPRATNIINIKRMTERQMHRDGTYDMQLEDLGMACTILEKGGMMFTLPTLLFTIPSMEKNPRTEPQFHGEEKNLWKRGWQAMCNKSPDIVPYITFTSINMKYFNIKRPININWNKWNKDNGLQKIIEEW